MSREERERAAHEEQLSDRMVMWMLDAERRIGLDATRAVLSKAIEYIDKRIAGSK